MGTRLCLRVAVATAACTRSCWGSVGPVGAGAAGTPSQSWPSSGRGSSAPRKMTTRVSRLAKRRWRHVSGMHTLLAPPGVQYCSSVGRRPGGLQHIRMDMFIAI